MPRDPGAHPHHLLDTEVQSRGGVAIVYYIARYDYVGADGHADSVRLRSIDIHQRDGAGWIPCESPISVIPASASWKDHRVTR